MLIKKNYKLDISRAKRVFDEKTIKCLLKFNIFFYIYGSLFIYGVFHSKSTYQIYIHTLTLLSVFFFKFSILLVHIKRSSQL